MNKGCDGWVVEADKRMREFLEIFFRQLAFVTSACGEVRSELRYGVKERRDFVERTESDEGFEIGEGNGDFGFVVGVWVFIWVFFVQFFGDGFIWMDLECEGFVEG